MPFLLFYSSLGESSVYLSWSVLFRFKSNSGFPSKRINLSPFTKDFRGGEQLNESYSIFSIAHFGGFKQIKCIETYN